MTDVSKLQGQSSHKLSPLVPFPSTTPSMYLITNTHTLLTIDSVPLYIAECAKEALCLDIVFVSG